MNSIEVQNKLALPHEGTDSPVHRLISGKTRLPGESDDCSEVQTPAWSASWWGLDASNLFKALSPAVQQTVVEGCNRAILSEAYFIEKSGLAYSAKMTLLAESTDIAQLYALIGADEARHLAWLEPSLSPAEKTSPDGQFLTFLSQLIEHAPPHLLIYLVQIILEGWGLDHYRLLAEGCEQPHLSRVFSSILKDEALHHRSGQLLFHPELFSAVDFKFIKESLVTYTQMVQVGPHAALAAVERAAGGLSKANVIELMQSLGHPQETARKLELLKTLMRQRGIEHLVDELENSGCFLPMSLEEAATSYLECR